MAVKKKHIKFENKIVAKQRRIWNRTLLSSLNIMVPELLKTFPLLLCYGTAAKATDKHAVSELKKLNNPWEVSSSCIRNAL